MRICWLFARSAPGQHPGLFCTESSAFIGQVFAVTADDMFLFAIVDNSTKIEIMAARYEIIDGTTSWVWHPIQGITLTGCEHTSVQTVGQKRLWITSTLGTDNIQYLPLPTGYGDIPTDSNAAFSTNGYFTTPILQGGFPYETKGLVSLTATLGHANDTNIYWECWFKTLGGSYVDMGDLKGTATDRTHTLYRTTSTSSAGFQFKFVGKTDDSSKTPILLSYTSKMILFTTIRKLYRMTVRVGVGVTDKNGLPWSNKVTLQKACLDEARNPSWLVTITDIEGTTKTVKFLPLQIPRRVPVYDEKGRVLEWEYNILCLDVATS